MRVSQDLMWRKILKNFGFWMGSKQGLSPKRLPSCVQCIVLLGLWFNLHGICGCIASQVTTVQCEEQSSTDLGIISHLWWLQAIKSDLQKQWRPANLMFQAAFGWSENFRPAGWFGCFSSHYYSASSSRYSISLSHNQPLQCFGLFFQTSERDLLCVLCRSMISCWYKIEQTIWNIFFFHKGTSK